MVKLKSKKVYPAPRTWVTELDLMGIVCSSPIDFEVTIDDLVAPVPDEGEDPEPEYFGS